MSHENQPDFRPTYDQLTRLGHWTDELIVRTINELQQMQQRGPTRISGMAIELDKAAEAAIGKWGREIEARDMPATFS